MRLRSLHRVSVFLTKLGLHLVSWTARTVLVVAIPGLYVRLLTLLSPTLGAGGASRPKTQAHQFARL